MYKKCAKLGSKDEVLKDNIKDIFNASDMLK